MRDVVIIGPPPTPNGDLHVGHMAGPYLAADVHARYLRADSRRVTYATGTDDHQTYVRVSAEKLGMAPDALCRRSWHEIRATLAAMGIAVDGFATMGAEYREAVLEFLGELHSAGKLELRTVRLPYSERDGEFLMEGLIEGDCPLCLAESRGGQCETCGHAVDFDALLNPRSRLDPGDVLTTREAEILVLPLEAYRLPLTRYHAAQQGRWRPHLVQLAGELLARPLPDFAITYPTGWGIPAPFPETPGQVINAWAEGMAQWMYCTAHAAGEDGLWRRERDTQLVYFLGFDNGFICAMAHVALLLAHGDRYVLPEMIVSNEFYELENEKFSTSKGHVIGVQELLAEVPRDVARFYLALTSPEHQRTNFSRAALTDVTSRRLVQPWNDLAELLAGEAAPDVTAGGWERAAAMLARFRACYELPAFSLARAADLIVVQLERLRRRAAERVDGDVFLETRALIAGAAPILIDVAAEAAEAGAFDGTFDAGLSPAPFELPRLAEFAGRAMTRVIVVGGGVIGLLTALECVRAGAEVTVVDQADLPHGRATSHAAHRVVRALHPGDPETTAAALEAQRRWAELERVLLARLYRRTGALTVFGPGNGHAPALAGTERLGRAALASRYPQLRLAPGSTAILEREAGIVLANRALAATVGWLRFNPSARLLLRRRAVRVDGAAGAVVLADGSVLHGDAIVIAAGPWSRDLLPEAEAAALTLHRQSILYCDVPKRLRERWLGLPAVALPGGAWLVPPLAGAPLALSAHSAARPVAAITDHRTPPEWRTHLLERFGVLLDGLHPSWVVDSLDGYYLAHTATGGARVVSLDGGAVSAVSACGGSSFKFAPLIARSLAARALGVDPAPAHGLALAA